MIDTMVVTLWLDIVSVMLSLFHRGCHTHCKSDVIVILELHLW